MQKMQIRDILLPVAAALFFIILFLIVGVPVLLSAALAGVFLLGLYYVSGPNRFHFGKISVDSEAEYKSLESIIGDGYKKLTELKGYAKKIHNPTMTSYAWQICQIGDKIFDYIQKNPEKVRGAREFFSYYLGTSCSIFEKYYGIEAQGLNTPDILDSVKNAVDTAKLLVDCYQKQLEKLIEGDVFDLETEINVLRKTLQSGELS